MHLYPLLNLTAVETKSSEEYWIRKLGLYSMDHVNILAGEWLTDNIIDATQKTLIGMGGLQPIIIILCMVGW